MDILLFFKELFIRLKAKSPAFFKVIQVIALIAGLVTGIPDLLTHFGVILPAALQSIESTAVSIASFVVLFIASLTVDPKVVNTPVPAPIVDPAKKVTLPYTQNHS